MKAYFISNFTKHPKLILENNQMIDLFDMHDDDIPLLTSLNTVIKDYCIDEIVVNNIQSQELFNYLNTVCTYNHTDKLKITLQEN